MKGMINKDMKHVVRIAGKDLLSEALHEARMYLGAGKWIRFEADSDLDWDTDAVEKQLRDEIVEEYWDLLDFRMDGGMEFMHADLSKNIKE